MNVDGANLLATNRSAPQAPRPRLTPLQIGVGGALAALAGVLSLFVSILALRCATSPGAFSPWRHDLRTLNDMRGLAWVLSEFGRDHPSAEGEGEALLEWLHQGNYISDEFRADLTRNSIQASLRADATGARSLIQVVYPGKSASVHDDIVVTGRSRPFAELVHVGQYWRKYHAFLAPIVIVGVTCWLSVALARHRWVLLERSLISRVGRILTCGVVPTALTVSVYLWALDGQRWSSARFMARPAELWFFFAVWAAALWLWIPRAWRWGIQLESERAAARGHCVCGYDLVGLPATSALCPECGRRRLSIETPHGPANVA